MVRIFRKGNEEFKVYKTTWTFSIDGKFDSQGKVDENLYKFILMNGYKRVF